MFKMAQVKKGDFIEVEYTGKIADDNIVFDTTDKAVADEYGLSQNITEFGPVTICLGEGMILNGLEDQLEGQDIGKEISIELSPEQGFGKKDAKLIQMIPMRAFKKNNVNPEPGLQINMDGMVGIIKTANSGRCMVDFNHPLSGKNLNYKVKIIKTVDDDNEKLKSVLKLKFHIKKPEFTIKEGVAEVKAMQEVPTEITKKMSEDIAKLIPTIKETKFVVSKPQKKE